MDVLPAHLNRDSFRDSFKGLVALEIILDLPFGFPINNIISLDVCWYSVREFHVGWWLNSSNLERAEMRLLVMSLVPGHWSRTCISVQVGASGLLH